MAKIYIYGNRYTENLGGSRDDDEWSRDSTSTSWGVVGAGEKVPSNFDAFDDIETDLESGKGYALYAVHSSGDSFGHDQGAYFQVIWIFDSKEMVEAAIAKIKEHAAWYSDRNSYRPKKVDAKKFKDDYSVEIDVGGKMLTVSASWNGYFESLDEIDYVIFHL